MTQVTLTRKQAVREHVERTYEPGELFRVVDVADALGWWNEKGCANVEFSIRELADEGTLWRFVDVERRRAPGRIDYVRFARAVAPPPR